MYNHYEPNIALHKSILNRDGSFGKPLESVAIIVFVHKQNHTM